MINQPGGARYCQVSICYCWRQLAYDTYEYVVKSVTVIDPSCNTDWVPTQMTDYWGAARDKLFFDDPQHFIPPCTESFRIKVQVAKATCIQTTIILVGNPAQVNAYQAFISDCGGSTMGYCMKVYDRVCKDANGVITWSDVHSYTVGEVTCPDGCTAQPCN